MNKLEQVLKQTSIRILEDWAMALVDELPIDQICFDPQKPFYLSWVNMRGAKNGTLSIVAQANFMQALTANLLGLESPDQVDLEQGRDAFREMGNVLAGNLFTAAFGAETTFDLLYPSVVEVSEDQVDKLLKQNPAYCFRADESPILITFSLKN